MNRFLSLVISLLMMIAAALTVNHSLFGRQFDKTYSSEELKDRNNAVSVVNQGEKDEVVINTTGLPDVVDGYAGKVPLTITIRDSHITKIELLPNEETPGFCKRASKILDSWIGKTTEEALEMEVDAISGATYTSEAIKSNVKSGLAYYEGQKATQESKVPLKIWIALVVVLAACIIPLFVSNKIYHRVQLLANIIVLGFWGGQFLNYSSMLKYLSGGIAWPAGIVIAVMLVAAFVYPLFGKPQYYCNHICPLGSAQELMAELCGVKLHIPVKIIKAFDWFRRILWGVLMVFLWIDVATDWMDLELFQAFQVESAYTAIIVVACIFIALSTIISRPYCRFVCPTGSLFKRAENFG